MTAGGPAHTVADDMPQTATPSPILGIAGRRGEMPG
jgi:hypothetical protein